MTNINGHQRPVFASYPSPMERRRPVTSEKQAPKKFGLSWDPSKIVKYIALGFVMWEFPKVSAQNPEKTCAATQKAQIQKLQIQLQELRLQIQLQRPQAQRPQAQKPQMYCFAEHHNYHNQVIHQIMMHPAFKAGLEDGKIISILDEHVPNNRTNPCYLEPLTKYGGASYQKSPYFPKTSLSPDEMFIRFCPLDYHRNSSYDAINLHGKRIDDLVVNELTNLKKNYISGVLAKSSLEDLQDEITRLKKMCHTNIQDELKLFKETLSRNQDFLENIERFFQPGSPTFVTMGIMHDLLALIAGQNFDQHCKNVYYVPAEMKNKAETLILKTIILFQFCEVLSEAAEAKSVSEVMKIFEKLP